MTTAKNNIDAIQHTNPKRESKLLAPCSLHLTGIKCVTKIVTDLGVFEFTPEGFKCVEHAPDVTIDEIKAKTAGRLVFAVDLKPVAI